MKARSQAQKMTQKLVRKWQKDLLAHFYLLTGPKSEQRLEKNRQFLSAWTEDFLIQVLRQEYELDYDRAQEKIQMGHPDILWITPQQKNSYTLQTGELEELFRSQNYRPVEVRHRFVIVEDAQLINRYLANKLLKTLEEPQPATSLIFLNPSHGELLATLESRAVKIGLAGPDSDTTNVWSADQKFQNPRELLQGLEKVATQQQGESGQESTWKTYAEIMAQFVNSQVKSHHTQWDSDKLPLGQLLDELAISDSAQEQALISFLMEIESRKDTTFQQKQELLEIMKWSEESRLYYNSRRARLWQHLEQVFTFG